MKGFKLKRPGALTAKAHSAHKSIPAYAREVAANPSRFSTTTRREVNFYNNIVKPHAKRK